MSRQKRREKEPENHLEPKHLQVLDLLLLVGNATCEVLERLDDVRQCFVLHFRLDALLQLVVRQLVEVGGHRVDDWHEVLFHSLWRQNVVAKAKRPLIAK